MIGADIFVFFLTVFYYNFTSQSPTPDDLPEFQNSVAKLVSSMNDVSVQLVRKYDYFVLITQYPFPSVEDFDVPSALSDTFSTIHHGLSSLLKGRQHARDLVTQIFEQNTELTAEVGRFGVVFTEELRIRSVTYSELVAIRFDSY